MRHTSGESSCGVAEAKALCKKRCASDSQEAQRHERLVAAGLSNHLQPRRVTWLTSPTS